MGIKGLFKIISTKFPEVIEHIDLRGLIDKRVAIDISTYLYKHLAIGGYRGWLKSFLMFLSYFRRHFIHVVVVFDSAPPKEKKETGDKRLKLKQEMATRVEALQKDLEEYMQTGKASEELKAIALMDCELSSDLIDVDTVKRVIQTLERRQIKITSDITNTLRQLLDVLNIPWVKAVTEAEKYCASLYRCGMVDAIIGEDSDTLTYGVDLICKINISKHWGYKYNYKKLLELTGFSPEQFLDFCILCGTDYNPSTYKIGPVGAYYKIKAQTPIEGIVAFDVEPIRNLFTKLDQCSDIAYCSYPDYNKLQFMMDDKGIYLNPKLLFPERQIILL
jgi:5'-3' exonuclease